MENFKLSIQFDPFGLHTLHSTGQKVILVREFMYSDENLVVWIAFDPFQYNTLQWSDEYSIYASTVPIQAGKIVYMATSMAANPGSIYIYNQTGFTEQTNKLAPDQFGIENNDSTINLLTVGLAQRIDINDGVQTVRPQNATYVPYSQKGIFQPLDRLLVFNASQLSDGSIFSSDILTIAEAQLEMVPIPLSGIVVSKAMLVDFSTDPSQTIHYDSTANAYRNGPIS